MVYIMYMYVNKRVELARWGIALQKIICIIIMADTAAEFCNKRNRVTVCCMITDIVTECCKKCKHVIERCTITVTATQ